MSTVTRRVNGEVKIYTRPPPVLCLGSKLLLLDNDKNSTQVRP